MKKLGQFLILSLCALMLVSCSKAEGGAVYDSYVNSETAPEASLGGTTAGGAEVSEDSVVNPGDRKLIRDVDLRVETKGFDSLIADLNDRVLAMGGYIEQSDISGSAYEMERSERRAAIIYRVPAVKLDEFLDHVGENSNIVQRSEQTRDVTLTYVDLESRIKTLEAEKTALTELLANATSTDAILSIREQLNDVIYQYESATAQLRALSEQVDFSTVTMNISEVIEYTEPVEEDLTLWEEISGGFVRSCRDIGAGLVAIFTFLAVNSPYLVLLGLIFIGVPVALYLFVTRKSRAIKREAKKRLSDK